MSISTWQPGRASRPTNFKENHWNRRDLWMCTLLRMVFIGIWMIPNDRMTGSDVSSVKINKILISHNHDSENPRPLDPPGNGTSLRLSKWQFAWQIPSEAHLKTRAICEDSPPSMGKLVMMGSTTSVKSMMGSHPFRCDSWTAMWSDVPSRKLI